MTQTAKLFKNGRSQAVRLPKEFRFEGEEVLIRRDPATGAVLLLKAPKSEVPGGFFAKEPGVDQTGLTESLPQRYLETGKAEEQFSVVSPSRSIQEWFDLFDAIDIPKEFFEREPHMPVERDIF
jgi:virulence-associated protein VagC